MRVVIAILLLSIAVPEIDAQSRELDKKEQRQLQRDERKRQARQDAIAMLEQTKLMVDSARFVLEADMVVYNEGHTHWVQSNLNYLLVDSTYGVFQIANTTSIGSNGLGGTTLEGRIENYEIIRNSKRNTFRVSFDLQTAIGLYSVILRTNSNGKANAQVNRSLLLSSLPESPTDAANRMYSPLKISKLRFTGDFVPLKESQVFRGNPY